MKVEECEREKEREGEEEREREKIGRGMDCIVVAIVAPCLVRSRP